MVTSPKEDYLLLLRQIVLDYVAQSPIKVYLFGSRARDTFHKTSDVDLALLSEEPLPIGFIAELKDIIEESIIPYQVDIVDLSQTDEEFRKKVLKEGKLWKD
jgi:predicted nucleotidyltransferase